MSIPQEFEEILEKLKWTELERKEGEKSKQYENLQKEEEKLFELMRRKEELEKKLGIKFGGKKISHSRTNDSEKFSYENTKMSIRSWVLTMLTTTGHNEQNGPEIKRT